MIRETYELTIDELDAVNGSAATIHMDFGYADLTVNITVALSDDF
jgi:hypothetical protein